MPSASQIILRIIPLLALAMLVLACSRPIVATGYLDDYTSFNQIDETERKFRLVEDQDFSIDKYFLTKAEIVEHDKEKKLPPDASADGVDLSRAQPILFIINPPQWLAETSLKKSQNEDVLFVIRERLYRYLLREYPHPVRVRYAFVPTDPLVEGYRVIHIDTAVTHIRKGSGASRFFIGYGVGATTMQIEGRMSEGRDAETPLGEFVLRDDHGGYPYGFLNPRVFYASYCLKYAAEQIVREFSEELREYLPAVRPAPAPIGSDVAQSPTDDQSQTEN